MSESYNLEKYSIEELKTALDPRNKSEKSAQSELSNIPPISIVRAIIDKQRVIYGVDDRKDYFEEHNKQYIKAVKSTVALFKSNQVKDMGDGTSELKVRNFGEAFNLCSDEKFRDQPVGSFCSGFLVAPDIIATAGHCVNDSDLNLKDTRFVFGYKMNNPGEPNTRINNSEIYKGERIIGKELESGRGRDWALIKLDRPVENLEEHTPLRVRREGKISDDTPCLCIGYPSGLPVKIAGGAAVRDNSNDAYFIANCDTYAANSGSSVFNAKTEDQQETPLVEGILVRGETDFVWEGSCRISLVCPTTDCRGEDITRTTLFANLIPEQET
jgi:hypothetical protein